MKSSHSLGCFPWLGPRLWFGNHGRSSPPPAAVPAVAARWRPRRCHRRCPRAPRFGLPAALRENDPLALPTPRCPPAAASRGYEQSYCSLYPPLYRQGKTIPTEFTTSSLSSLENITCYHITTWKISWKTFATHAYRSLSYALLRRGKLRHPLPWAVMTSPARMGKTHLGFPRSFFLCPLFTSR